MAFNREDFVWRGLALHFGRRSDPVLTVVPDATYQHLYRIRYSNGWSSSPANITRAKCAAYDHARHLLTGQRPPERAHSPEEGIAA